MFCDELRLKIVAGKGGDGCSSFRREKFVPKGGPDGGDGGNGGSVIIKVNTHLNTLGPLSKTKIYRAEKGEPGRGKKMHGRNAQDLILEVPIGTIIYDDKKKNIIADLSKASDEFTIAKGGKGGLGNARFATSTHQAPKFAESGEAGEQKEITLELKMVADVGIIGLPSAGKSTLISIISNARPKIAEYHFTTLIPNLGMVEMSKFGGSKNQAFVIADIPGLIEGASEGKGLGHQFLKHTTRTKFLVHVIDGTLENIGKNYRTIRTELKKFDKELSTKREVVVINKIDMLNEKELEKKIKELKKKNIEDIYPISALTQTGVKPLMFEVYKTLEAVIKEDSKKKAAKPKELPVILEKKRREKFSIDKVVKKKGVQIFTVSGDRLIQLVSMTNLASQEGLERAYRYVERIGLKKALQKRKANIDDIIEIGEKIMFYRP